MGAVLLLRKLVFYLFVAIYLVLCPLTILYALGYLFKPGSEHGIVKTGLLYLSTAPPGASVYIDKMRYTEKTPAIIQDLLPGNYSVTIALKNYRPWTQTVPLEAGRSTALEKILFVPEQWEPQELAADSFKELIPLPGIPRLLAKKGPDAGDEFVYDLESEELWPLLPTGSPFRDAKVLAHTAVTESPCFLLWADSPQGKRFLWVESQGKESLIEDLTSLFMEKPSRVDWDPDEKRYLFALQEGALNRLDILSKAVYPKFLEQLRGYGLFHKMIYILREDGRFTRLDEEGKNEEVALSDPATTKSLFGERGFFQVKILPKEIILFWGERGELFANRLPYRFVEAGVRGFEFDADHERLLLWQKDKIGVLDFSKQTGDEDLFEQGPKLLWVFKKGRDIEQAFWVYEGSHILFRDQDGIFLLELETFGKPRVNQMFRVKTNSSILYSEVTGKLYFLEATQGHLCSADILPRQNLLLPLTEKLERPKRSGIQEE